MKRFVSAIAATAVATAGIIAAPAAGAATVAYAGNQKCSIQTTVEEWRELSWSANHIYEISRSDPETFTLAKATDRKQELELYIQETISDPQTSAEIYRSNMLHDVVDAYSLCIALINKAGATPLPGTPTPGTTTQPAPNQPQAPSDSSSSSADSSSADGDAIGGILAALTPLVKQMAVISQALR